MNVTTVSGPCVLGLGDRGAEMPASGGVPPSPTSMHAKPASDDAGSKADTEGQNRSAEAKGASASVEAPGGNGSPGVGAAMQQAMKRSRNWAFTWNNYTEDDVKSTASWVTQFGFRCVMFGREVGKNGTPHLQGLFVTKTDKSWKQIKELLPPAVHFEAMYKPLEANVTYCSKDRTGITIHGDLPKSRAEKGAGGVAGAPFGIQGKAAGEANSNWRMYHEDIKAGMPWSMLVHKYAFMHGMYNKGFKEAYEEFKPKASYDIRKRHPELYPWQAEILGILSEKPHPRHVHWVWSQDGDVGKTEVCKHLVSSMGFTPIGNAKFEHMACAWKGTHTVIDLPRSEGEVNYQFIEKAKDGMVFSSKYASETKMSADLEPTHVVCFANALPDSTKLSKDRWRIYTIQPDKSWKLATVLDCGIVP